MAKEFTVDGNTLALWHMNGTVASAAKKDNAEGTAGLDLVESNTPTATDGFDGATNGAYGINGSNQKVESAGSVTDGTQTALSIEGWFYADSLASVKFLCSQSAGGAGMLLYHNGTSLILRTRYSGGGGDQDTPGHTITTGQWYYIAGTVDGPSGTSRLYVDGDEKQTKAMTGASGNLGSTVCTIGAIGGGNFFAGRPDEVRISDTDRSAAEILAYWESQSATGVDHQNLITLMGIQ